MAGSSAIYATARTEERNALLRLTARSDRKGLFQLACHLGALLATGFLVWSARGSLWLLPAMLLHGIVLVFLFAPLHESIHWTAFRGRRLNDAVAFASGALLLLPPGYFRAFHFAHHRHTQDPARDPELTRPKPRTLGAYLWYATGLPYWRERIATTVRHACARVDEPFIGARQKPAIEREARLLLFVYLLALIASIAAASDALPYLWLGRPCSASRSCAFICSPSTPAVRWSRTCSRTRGPRGVSRQFAGSPGTCLTTPNTTPTRRCRSMRCRRRTGS
jgi:fatty acid desaturase